jgi:hypothetical protein
VSTLAARRSAARVARFDAGATPFPLASGAWLVAWAVAALVGFFVIPYL